MYKNRYRNMYRKEYKMLIVKSIDIRNNFKSWCEKVVNGETVVISRPRNENVYIIGEKEYNELKKAKEKAEYLTMLNESLKQLEEKETITLTMEELEKMANE